VPYSTQTTRREAGAVNPTIMSQSFPNFPTIAMALLMAPPPDISAETAASERDAQLTKPTGALARLEDCIRHLAAWQSRAVPALDRVQIVIFAGNHGVAARGVSAYPAEVTVQMVANFQSGGGAINQLARLHGATLSVVPLELSRPTVDFTLDPAMTEAECLDAINRGVAAVAPDLDLLIVGEMGIGNTTAAAAVTAALYGGDAASWVGPGTGVSGPSLKNKIFAVDAGLRLHAGHLNDPLETLRRLGGREIAALFGAILAARLRGIPVLLDGFVVGAAAAVLARLSDTGLAHCLAGHVSAEPGHRRLLNILDKVPLLDLGMRLGEGSGAAVALGVLKAAVACHAGMATFTEAAVSKRGTD
jgi:nicotinate-nucleotide--dimethylbenzimidazole phosphoribosyltransferase